MFAFPVASILIGIIGYLIFKNIYLAPILVAIISVTANLTILHSLLWFWLILYTLLSLLAGLCVKLLSVLKSSNKQSRLL
ncbi:DUF2651 family protein [Pseudogracilibacillus sp. SO30301A]|uniref:DUF2651 family protein n=1 Tax=Pseudogracilibacillus sp. SO30301A TaxID=3098291 RepID=UPI003FA7466F